MASVDPLNISPFFNAADSLARKKEKEKTGIHTKKEFAELVKKNTDVQSDSAEYIFTPEAAGEKIDNAFFDEKLTELVDAVYAAGDELKKKPYADTFLTYKQSLSRFMRFVIDNSYEVEVRERRKGKKRQQLITIQTINTKLDELAAGILYNQSDQLKILAKIEEINGILVDFLS